MWGYKLEFSLLSARPHRMVSQEYLAINVVAWTLSLPGFACCGQDGKCLAVSRRSSIFDLFAFALKRGKVCS